MPQIVFFLIHDSKIRYKTWFKWWLMRQTACSGRHPPMTGRANCRGMGLFPIWEHKIWFDGSWVGEHRREAATKRPQGREPNTQSLPRVIKLCPEVVLIEDRLEWGLGFVHLERHDSVERLELFGRRQCLVLVPFLLVLWLHVFGHDIRAEVGPGRLVRAARSALPVRHVDLPPKVFAKQADCLYKRGCLDVTVRHVQLELLFVGRLPGARLFLQHDHYSDAEVRNKVCKWTCNCNRPQVHRFAPLDNALLKVLWTMLWTHSLKSGVWRGLNVVKVGFICRIPHLRRHELDTLSKI